MLSLLLKVTNSNVVLKFKTKSFVILSLPYYVHQKITSDPNEYTHTRQAVGDKEESKGVKFLE